MDQREEFLSIFSQHVTRPGADKLLAWLDTTDFFRAPASTRFHGACAGGLLMHSLNVYHCLREHYFEPGDSEESFALCALLHDVCKANFYKPGTRNVKNEATGQWEKVPTFTIEDAFPYGHGEKSVYIISGYMRLTREEAFAIRYHMGFSGIEDKNSIGKAFEMFPLAFALSVADMEASYFIEGTK